VSAENVELVRSVQPGPEVDLVALFADDDAAGQLAEALASLLIPASSAGSTIPAASAVAATPSGRLTHGSPPWPSTPRNAFSLPEPRPWELANTKTRLSSASCPMNRCRNPKNRYRLPRPRHLRHAKSSRPLRQRVPRQVENSNLLRSLRHCRPCARLGHVLAPPDVAVTAQRSDAIWVATGSRGTSRENAAAFAERVTGRAGAKCSRRPHARR
jgi:hypothetical protein